MQNVQYRRTSRNFTFAEILRTCIKYRKFYLNFFSKCHLKIEKTIGHKHIGIFSTSKIRYIYSLNNKRHQSLTQSAN